MFSKIVIIIIMLLILGALGSGLLFLIRDKGGETRLLKALTLRIALSIFLFLLLLAGFYFGLLTPH